MMKSQENTTTNCKENVCATFEIHHFLGFANDQWCSLNNQLKKIS